MPDPSAPVPEASEPEAVLEPLPEPAVVEKGEKEAEMQEAWHEA